jgi:Dolichyl-phosphate-mannose-protein mannosyltransferase
MDSSMNTSDNLSESASTAKLSRFPAGSIPLPAFAFLALTAAVSLLLSHESLMWFDEFLVLWTGSIPSIGKLIHLQLTFPISLHPLAYHVIEYLAIRLAGAGAFAIRLPSLFGYLLMQVCLFIFVRRLASERAAIFALAFPALTSTLIFAAQGSPYALLLGWFGLAMVAWQTAARRESQRMPALVTLALAIALAINTHFFGILLLAPLLGAELYRSFERRKLDFAVVASILAGMTGILLLLPSLKAVAEFSNHYYISALANPQIIAGAYLSILPGYGFTQRHEAMGALFLAIVALACLWSCIRQIRGGTILVSGAEAVLLVLMVALPFFGYLLAAVETHAIAVRFVEGATLGVTPLLAVALVPLLRRPTAGRFVLIALFASLALVGGMHIRAARDKAQGTMSKLRLEPNVKATLMATPNEPIYFEGAYTFSVVSFYEPDPELRSRMALVYSRDQELRWRHGDTSSLTALNMRMFTGYTIVPYETLTREPSDHLFVVFPGMDDDWTSLAFAASHADVKPLGPVLGGELISVRFHP